LQSACQIEAGIAGRNCFVFRGSLRDGRCVVFESAKGCAISDSEAEGAPSDPLHDVVVLFPVITEESSSSH
jgi:hypothetical protein